MEDIMVKFREVCKCHGIHVVVNWSCLKGVEKWNNRHCAAVTVTTHCGVLNWMDNKCSHYEECVSVNTSVFSNKYVKMFGLFCNFNG
jgi:hypothetical protein